MAIFQNSLSNCNLTIKKQDVLIEELTETLDFNDDIFDVVLVNEELSGVDVSINLDKLEGAQFERVTTAVDYTLVEGINYIGVDTTDRVTITLEEAPFEGRKIIIKDETGNAVRRPITVVTQGSDLIDNKQSIVMKLRYIALQFIYTQGQWRLI